MSEKKEESNGNSTVPKNPNMGQAIAPGVVANQPLQLQQQPLVTQMQDGTFVMFPHHHPPIQQIPSSPLFIQPPQNPVANAALQWSSNIRKDSSSNSNPSPGTTVNAMTPVANPVHITPYSPYGSMIQLGQPAVAFGQSTAVVGSRNPSFVGMPAPNPMKSSTGEDSDQEEDEDGEDETKKPKFLTRFFTVAIEGLSCCSEGLIMFCECAGKAHR